MKRKLTNILLCLLLVLCLCPKALAATLDTTKVSVDNTASDKTVVTISGDDTVLKALAVEGKTAKIAVGTVFADNAQVHVVLRGDSFDEIMESAWVTKNGETMVQFTVPMAGTYEICAGEVKNTASVTGADGETKHYATLAAALAAANDTETVKLLVDASVDETIRIEKAIKLDLNGKTVSATDQLQNGPVFRILADVTVTNGTVDGTTGINSYAFIVGSDTAEGTLNIADGTYKGITSAVSVTKGTANLSGGTFSAAHDNEGTDYGAQYLLNCMDDAYKAGTAKYNITGGTYVQFNPEDNLAEGAGTDFVASGYRAVASGNNWIVEKAPVKIPENTSNVVTAPEGSGVTQEQVENLLGEIENNKAMDKEPEGVPENVELVIELVSVSVNENTVPTALSFDVAPMQGEEKIEELAEPITFRLPIPASVTETNAKIYHEGSIMGLKPIQTDNGAKYVEITAQEFSNYTVQPTVDDRIYFAHIADTRYETLDAAMAEAKNGATIKVMEDIKTVPDTQVEMEVTIDINGKHLWLENPLNALKAIAGYGYDVKDNGDGTYTFARAVITGEAAVGQVIYKTLEEAIDAATDGGFINLIADATKPTEGFEIKKNLVIVPNGYSFWDAENGLAALSEITNADYEVTTNYGLYFINKLPENQTNVAEINGVEYKTVEDALKAAKYGDVVEMIADSVEADSDLVVNKGITLYLNTYDLTAKSVVGHNGSYVYGQSYHATDDDCLLVTDSLRLSEKAPVVKDNGIDYNVIPIFDPSQNGYVFAYYNVYTNHSFYGLTINKETQELGFKFNQQTKTVIRTGLLGDKYTAAGNKFRVILRVTWESAADDGVYNQNFEYKDDFVKQCTASSGNYYGYILRGYELFGLNEETMDTLKVQAMVVTDSGVVASSNVFTEANPKN